MKRLQSVIIALSIVLGVSYTVLAAPDEAADVDAKKEDNGVKVFECAKPQGNRARVKVELVPELVKEFDVYLAVQPQLASDTVWLQGTKLISGKPQTRAVYVGTEAELREPESFDILLLRCPKGTFKKAGPVKAGDLEDLGVEVIAAETVERLK